MRHFLTLNSVLRAFAILTLLSRDYYWRLTEAKSDAEKPRLKRRSMIEQLRRNISLVWGVIIYLQLLGLNLLPFPVSPADQMLGLVIVFLGFATCMIARRSLGSNWAHGAEYQIKTNHTLTTGGIYAFIRHPIYTGIFLSMIGAEIVSGSLLFVALLVILPIVAVNQAKKEELILTKAFGDDYVSYVGKTKMLIPYLW